MPYMDRARGVRRDEDDTGRSRIFGLFRELRFALRPSSDVRPLPGKVFKDFTARGSA